VVRACNTARYTDRNAAGESTSSRCAMVSEPVTAGALKPAVAPAAPTAGGEVVGEVVEEVPTVDALGDDARIESMVVVVVVVVVFSTRSCRGWERARQRERENKRKREGKKKKKKAEMGVVVNVSEGKIGGRETDKVRRSRNQEIQKDGLRRRNKKT
jgi:hypothetical protein